MTPPKGASAGEAESRGVPDLQGRAQEAQSLLNYYSQDKLLQQWGYMNLNNYVMVGDPAQSNIAGLVTPAILAAADAVAVLSGSEALGVVTVVMLVLTIAFLYFVLGLFVAADLLGHGASSGPAGSHRRGQPRARAVSHLSDRQPTRPASSHRSMTIGDTAPRPRNAIFRGPQGRVSRCVA